jgi:hypothetical protein
MFEQFVQYLSEDNALFIVIGLLGMLAHAIKKYYANELSGNIIDYLFRNNKKRSVLAVLTTIGALITVIFNNQVPNQFGSFVMLAFTTGFTADSTVNRDVEKS